MLALVWGRGLDFAVWKCSAKHYIAKSDIYDTGHVLWEKQIYGVHMSMLCWFLLSMGVCKSPNDGDV